MGRNGRSLRYQRVPVAEQEQLDDVDAELSVRLHNVMRSLQTQSLMKIVEDGSGERETERAFQERMKKSLQGSMDQIDATYREMDQRERAQAFKKKETVADEAR